MADEKVLHRLPRWDVLPSIIVFVTLPFASRGLRIIHAAKAVSGVELQGLPAMASGHVGRIHPPLVKSCRSLNFANANPEGHPGG